MSDAARLRALLGALALLWLAFAAWSDGLFVSPRNLVNLAVQASAVGVMACGMVLVIAARQIDLSVGSVLGFAGMVIAGLLISAAWVFLVAAFAAYVVIAWPG